MKKNKLLLIGTIVLAMALIGCPNDQTAGQIIVSDNTNKDQSDDKTSTTIIPTVSTTIPNGNSMKITSLRVAIEMADYGDVIDFTAEKYNEITDFSNVNINKALTITNFGNMKSETITVSADGVWLNNIGSVSITTNSSLKISGSSLASLNIINVETSSANESGRGGTSAAFAGRSSDKAPTVEVSDTIVSDEVTLGIAGAYLSVDKLDAADAILNLDAANTKLAIADRQTNIKEIKTDKICQVILENGTSDNIPTPNVSGEGELKQIDMKAAGTLKLLALTPMSGLTTVVKKGEAIDFGNVIVLGTYQADDGVTVFKANGLSYNLTETFSKLEKEFTISIGTDEVYKNGENVSAFDWTALDAGEHSAKIDCECSKDDSYKAYEFSITVTEEAELPTPTLTAIEVYLGANIGTTYLAGDTLDLGTMLVMGVYKAGSITYKNILTDYTLSRQIGTILTTADTAVTVSIPGEDVTGTINLTVKPAVFVTFQVAEGQTIVSRIEQNTKVTAPLNISRIGYTFDSWYDDAACTSEHDFSTTVSQSTTLYAKWYPNAPHIITYHYQNGAPDQTVDFYEFNDVALDLSPTKDGYTFGNWCEDGQCSGPAITGWRMGQRTGDVELWAKWNPFGYDITYIDLSADNGTAPMVTDKCAQTHIYDKDTEIGVPTKMGHTFAGWYMSADGDSAIATIGAEYKENVTLYAKWTYGMEVSVDKLSALMADLTADYNPYLIKITDASPDLLMIRSALTDHTSITIDLDLSQCTGMSEITDSAFAGKYSSQIKNLRSIVIPEGVTKIGQNAFYYCSGLEKVTIPASVQLIQNSAFGSSNNISVIDYKGSLEQWFSIDVGNYLASPFKNGTGLYIDGELMTEVTIPDSVTEIKHYTFYNYKKLTKLTIHANVTEFGSSSFYDCASLGTVNYAGTLAQWCNIDFTGFTNPLSPGRAGLYIDGTLVTDVTLPAAENIKQSIFRGYKHLKSVTIPSGVQSIGSYAFANSTIESATIPATVGSFNEAFKECSSLKDINYTGSLSDWMRINFTKSEDNPLYYATTDYQRQLKINGNVVTSVTVPNDITSIPQYTFAGYKQLSSVEIGAHVQNIGQYAFQNCSALASVTIDDAVSDLIIGKGVFNNNSGLTNITIPAGVKSIGEMAFDGAGLQSITIADGVESIGKQAFGNCTALTVINIPDSVQSVGAETFKNCTALQSVELPFLGASPTDPSIFGYYFESSTSQPSGYSAYQISKYYKIPSSIKTVTVRGGDLAEYAFCNCEYLTSISIPAVENIPERTFIACKNLTSFTIPAGVQTIGAYAFGNCTKLADIAIPDSVTSIGEYCFTGCSMLEHITIPASVNHLEMRVFWDCTKLSGINYKGDIADWLDVTVDHYIATWGKYIKLYLNDVTADDIVIPDDITAIKDFVFANLDIKSITLGNGVTSIGNSAFGSSTLAEITISENVSTIGNDAFYSPTNLPKITVIIENTNAVIHCTGTRLFNTKAGTVYVPDDLTDDYNADTVWPKDATIRPISEKQN